MERVTLKDGTTVSQVALKTTTMQLETIIAIPGLLFELVEKCRDESYELKGSWLTRLQDASLVRSDGRVHDDVRATVLNSVEGEWSNMQIVDPFRKEEI